MPCSNSCAFDPPSSTAARPANNTHGCESHQRGKLSRQPIVLPIRPAIFDPDMPAFDKAGLLKRSGKTRIGGQSLLRTKPASPAAAPEPRAATPLLRRREAWLRIFVVRCSLPCDPSGWGSFMQWRDYTTLPSHRRRGTAALLGPAAHTS